MEIKGTIKHVFDTEQVNEKFRKRQVVITTTDDKYEQHIPVEFVQDNVDKLNNIIEGQEATIHINLQEVKETSESNETPF
jgi:hypothetical protein